VTASGPAQEVTFVVHEDGPVGLAAMQVTFDDERVVCDAGIVLVATLAERLGVEALAQRLVRLRTDRPGARNAGRKVIALIYAMALGTDCIDDRDVLRAGRTRRLLGGWIAAPSTLGTFLRAFTFGHVRQLDRVSAIALTRAWNFGAGPGARRLVVDISTASSARCTATASRAPRSATPPSAAITRCLPRARTPARSCMCACARDRPPARAAREVPALKQVARHAQPLIAIQRSGAGQPRVARQGEAQQAAQRHP
jgi:hypothetical protein